MLEESSVVPYAVSDLTGRRVLVLAPHPDDETIGCGGSLALHAAAGDPVKVVFVTSGARGDSSGARNPDEYVALRRQEAREACAALGITDLEFWPYEDRSVAGAKGLLKKMADLLESFRPELVYAPSPLEFHPDHRATCFRFCEALRSTDLDCTAAFCEVGQPLRVNTLVNITPVLEKKRKALDAYQSQLAERPYDEIGLGLNRFRALTLSREMTHAEGFSVWSADLIRQTGPLALPLQDVGRLAPDPGEAGPLVSVIVRTKDRPQLLTEALRSILSQTYANLEIVVVNDGGQDVRDVVSAVCGSLSVTHVSHEQNQGRAAAANSGLDAASGLYVCFLDDDDVLYPDHLETLVRAVLSTGTKVAYTGVRNAYYQGSPESPGKRVREEIIFNREFDPDLLLFANHIPLMSVLFHRDVGAELHGFSPELDLFEDWDFLIRASRRHPFFHVERVTAEYRFYGVENTEQSHRRKYAYDKAQAEIFDRVRPFLTGAAWIKFLQSELPYDLGRDRQTLQRQIAPLMAELEETKLQLGKFRQRVEEQEIQARQQEASETRLIMELAGRQAELQQTRKEVAGLRPALEQKEALLKEILASRGWAWLTRYRKMKLGLGLGRWTGKRAG